MMMVGYFTIQKSIRHLQFTVTVLYYPIILNMHVYVYVRVVCVGVGGLSSRGKGYTTYTNHYAHPIHDHKATDMTSCRIQ